MRANLTAMLLLPVSFYLLLKQVYYNTGGVGFVFFNMRTLNLPVTLFGCAIALTARYSRMT